MCDFTGKLTAWIDHELPPNDTADVELHLQSCEQCRGQVEAYHRLSGAFDAYCDAYCEASLARRSRRRPSRRTLAVSGTATAAAGIAALFLLAPRVRVQPTLARVPPPGAGATNISQLAPPAQRARIAAPAMKTVSPIERRKPAEQTRRAPARPQGQQATWVPADPAVQIAIPADAIFPPGAVPDGISFAADVAIAPDGSAQQIRLLPQFIEFERRSNRP